MRAIRPTAGGVLLGVALMFLTSAVAQANPDPEGDDVNFISQARALGFVHSDVNLTSGGRSVCYVLRLGNRSPAEISTRIARSFVVSGDQARQFALLSANQWCPQWSSLFTN